MKKMFLIALILSVQYSFSQNTISGFVKNEDNKPVSKATVSLLKSKDSSLVKIAVTDTSGYFEFINAKAGNYILSISSVAYQKLRSQSFVFDATESLQLALLTLKRLEQVMNNITVQTSRPFIESRLDKTIVNVEALPSNNGATAMEVLEKSPGVIIDNDGNISLKGKQGVLIMIDGKPTYLSPSDLAIMLKGMSATTIDQIEIITNPSSQYDASGNAGIINIKTRKTSIVGFNGNISVGATISELKATSGNYVNTRFQNAINFNYRKNKVNYFGNYNPNYIEGGQDLIIRRIFYNTSQQVSGYSDQNTLFKFYNFNHALRLGFDFYYNPKNIFGISVRGSVLNGHPSPLTNTVLRQTDGQVFSSLSTQVKNPVTFKNLTSNVNWKHTIDTLRDLSADLDYVRYDNYSENFLLTNSYSGSGQFYDQSQIRSFAPITSDIYSFKTDYTNKIRNGSVESGIKLSKSRNDNLINYEDLVSNQWKTDPRSNHFVYTEIIEAAYLSVNQKIKKWSYKIGVRVENTNAKGNQLTTKTEFERNYIDFFPNLLLSYSPDKNNSFSASLGRRIQRPGYRDLNPFIMMTDSLSFHMGNSNLKPEYSNNAEVNYSYKNKIFVTANYSKTNGVMSQIFRLENVGSTQRTIMTRENIANLVNFGLSVTKPYQFAKWWNGNLFVNVFKNHFNGYYTSIDRIDLSKTSLILNLTNSFKLGKGYGMELSGFYNSKGLGQLSFSDPVYQISIGAQKQILKSKGMLRLTVRDPFAWQKFGNLAQYGNVYNKSVGYPDSRQISLNFSYRFGKNEKQVRTRNHSTASQEEQSRL